MVNRAMCIGWLVVALTAGAAPAAAQAGDDVGAANTVHLELFGPGLLYSVNYDRLALPTVSLRAGASFSVIKGVNFDLPGGSYESSDNTVTMALLTLSASWLRGEPPHYLEAGGGMIPGYVAREIVDTGDTDTDFVWGFTGILGYRYQPQAGGLFVRATYTPTWIAGAFAPLWGGVSVGWSF